MKFFLKKKINYGFSLVDMIVSVTAFTFFIVLMVGGSFALHKHFEDIKLLLVENDKITSFVEQIQSDILNVNLYPRMPEKEYLFEINKISFFSNDIKVEYLFEEEAFIIKKGEKTNKYPFVKDFTIKYYDIDDILTNKYPYYCILYFTLKNKKNVELKMIL
ncbi:MAG: hypothetical protein A2086_15600 [Spirochaetes bacterium GWD1_27_9]|nr:MAG: hypothetical protein A2Z98_14240 [Spirochaetes bacterium GWB1_27_13]OHD22494.1 MAG: hypothetical protein A2Y34_06745 [Spirochaetes bacterium GWC1_27_15]OHD42806.1 MAG: hypothetical protein A2086_15600 [Spirochaetes bacterium GWD1_27_9]